MSGNLEGHRSNPSSHMNAEWDAAAYHRLSDPQVAWGEKILNRLSLRGDETVLDAGCGTGRLTAELLERLPHGQVIAVDQSTNMLHLASEYLSPRFGERVTFIQADLESLDLQQVAHVIFSTATFHWIRNHAQLFRNLYHALKPGGRLIAQCGGGPNLNRLFEQASVIMHSQPYDRYFSDWHNPWEFADVSTSTRRLHDAGFVDVEADLEVAPVTLSNDREYHAFLGTVIFRVHLERLPEESLRQRFLDQITEQAARSDPPFLLDYCRLNLQGRRQA